MSTFDWHDYIAISDGFSPQEKALLEKSFDSIAAAHDNEGEELIRKAAGLNPPKLQVVPNKHKSGFFNDDKILNVNFDQIAAAEVRDGGNGPLRHVSLTGFMVHELFHASDPVASNSVSKAMQKIDNDEFAAEQKQGLIKPVPEGAAVAERDNPEAKVFAVTQTHTQDADHVALAEDRAMKYTDVFMQKNFGDQEPMRIRYYNGGLDTSTKNLSHEQKLAMITIPHNLKEVFRTYGYTPELPEQLAIKLGPLATPPSVKATIGINGRP